MTIKKYLLSIATIFVLSIQALAQALPATQFPYIYYGKTGDFAFQLTNNGTSVPLATFTPVVTWTCNDPAAILTPGSNTTTVSVSVPTTDTNTSITLTAVSTTPTAGVSSTPVTLTIPLIKEPANYGGIITQGAATN